MKFHPDVIRVQAIESYGEGWVQVAGTKLTRSVIIGSRGERSDWLCDRFEDLLPTHFEQIARLAPEVVIFGSGQRLRFVAPELTRSLIACQIGLETMDTQAACRTYNILASEGRCVLLAVLLERHQGEPLQR